MPGRFTLSTDAKALSATFPWLQVPEGIRPRYNIAPTQAVAVVTNEAPDLVDFMTWGLVPSWSKGIKMTKFLINARAESVATKKTFRASFKRRRCLVLADGVYEWLPEKNKKRKTPYYIYLKNRRPFAYAGLWENWLSIDGSEIKSCCIITTEPNELVARIHHRMGVILHEKDYFAWLQPGEVSSEELLPLLKPYPAEEMSYHQVSTLVSTPENDSPECIEPVERG